MRTLGAVVGVVEEPALIVQGNYSFESGLEQGGALLAMGQRSSAIFASNDEMAAGAIQAAYELGLRVPEALIRRINGEEEEGRIEMATSLVVRGSAVVWTEP